MTGIWYAETAHETHWATMVWVEEDITSMFNTEWLKTKKHNMDWDGIIFVGLGCDRSTDLITVLV